MCERQFRAQHMPEVLATTRGMQRAGELQSTQLEAEAAAQRAAATRAAAAAAGGRGSAAPSAAAPPTSAAQALEQLQPAKVAADEIHRKVQEELQPQLRRNAAEAAQVATAPAPGVQLRPAPEPFTTLPMPSNLPASSLPEPVRLARAGGIFPALASPADLEQMLQQHPHVGRVPDAGAATISQGNVFGLGTGVFDSLRAAGHPLVAQGSDGSLYQPCPAACCASTCPTTPCSSCCSSRARWGTPRRPCCSCPLHLLPPSQLLQSTCRPARLPWLQCLPCAPLSAWAPSSWMLWSKTRGCLQGSCSSCRWRPLLQCS
jgi:hypothetical protein